MAKSAVCYRCPFNQEVRFRTPVVWLNRLLCWVHATLKHRGV
jgi:hypothetical protein